MSEAADRFGWSDTFIDAVLVGKGDTETLAQAVKFFRDEFLRLEEVLNTPELHDFAKAVELEAKHQRARWGDRHDAEKTPHDWAAVALALLGKAVQASWDGDREKLLHHIITTAAVCNNWHAREVART